MLGDSISIGHHLHVLGESHTDDILVVKFDRFAVTFQCIRRCVVGIHPVLVQAGNPDPSGTQIAGIGLDYTGHFPGIRLNFTRIDLLTGGHFTLNDFRQS